MELAISDCHWYLSNMCTYNIELQSVADKIVREISLEVGEKLGKSQGTFFEIIGGNPDTSICATW